MTLELGPDDIRLKLRSAGSCRLCVRAHGAGAEAIYERLERRFVAWSATNRQSRRPRSKPWVAKPEHPRAEGTSDAGMPVSSGSAVSIRSSAG